LRTVIQQRYQHGRAYGISEKCRRPGDLRLDDDHEPIVDPDGRAVFQRAWKCQCIGAGSDLCAPALRMKKISGITARNVTPSSQKLSMNAFIIACRPTRP